MSVIEHIVHMLMTMMHLHTEVVHPISHMMPEVKSAGLGIWSSEKRKRSDCCKSELHRGVLLSFQ